MTNWKRGGWTGSLNRWVRREIGEHLRENAFARRTRYPRATQLLHGVFDGGTFERYIRLYLALLLLVSLAEALVAAYLPSWLPRWTGTAEFKPFLTNVASYLIGAQVGVLGVASIAIALVTIIAQREDSSTEVQIYYHESLAFGVVASSMALLAVLCAQLLWPVQFFLHSLGYGTGLQFFKLLLTTIHLAWLLLNLGGLAHFVATTLAFVQQTARERLRERYTTNVVLPAEMRRRLREQRYLGAGPAFAKEFWPAEGRAGKEPTVYMGADFSGAGEVEIPLKAQLVLRDVRMTFARWAVGRWLRRCHAAEAGQPDRPRPVLTHDPLLLFPPRLDVVAQTGTGLCRRRGGVPLSRWERLALRWAFKFTRMHNET
jgi:hypothetical protein